MSGEGAHAEFAQMPDVSESRRGGPPRGSQGERDLGILLREMQEDLRDPDAGTDTEDGVVAQLQSIIHDRGLTLERVATGAQMKKQQLSAILSGNTRSPGVVVLGRVAAALGYRISLTPLDTPDEAL